VRWHEKGINWLYESLCEPHIRVSEDHKSFLEYDDQSGLRSRSFFGWSRIPNKTRSRGRIFLFDSGSPPGLFFLHHTPKLVIPVEMVQFLLKLSLNQRILAVYHDLHLVLVATKLLTADFIHFMLRSRKFWKGRCWSRTFYLRPRYPANHILNYI